MRKQRKTDDITILNTYQFENEYQPLFSNYVLDPINVVRYDRYFEHSNLMTYHTMNILNGGYEVSDGDRVYALEKCSDKIYTTSILYDRCKFGCKVLGLDLKQIL